MRNKNHAKRGNGKNATILVVAVAAIMALIGILAGFEKLRDIYLEQCIVTDMDSQVSISPGKMVKADVIAMEFGLKKGANLALIDFGAKRKEILGRIHNLRNISITRRLPNRVAIVTEEREPIARLEIRGQRSSTGKVIDSDGIVFMCVRGTRMLPAIREKAIPGTAAGRRPPPRVLAALKLIEACRDSEYQEFGILEIDTASPDYLLVTIGNSYSKVKIAWEKMDEPESPTSIKSLNRQLSMLLKAMRSGIGEGAVIWNATDLSKPGRIYADMMKGTLK